VQPALVDNVKTFATIHKLGYRMLRIIQNSSVAGAMSYYATADYYTEGQELEGVWRGEGAERLGLQGRVDQARWNALCDNRHPESNQPLTLRRKEERRVGYDFNFHVPKSVSLLYSQTRDERLLEVFRESVDETMREMEAEMQTRVRKNGHNENRNTGNMVWGEFIHFTSRPVGGVPDPHLHAHCFVFNCTWDKTERSWKAGQFSDLKRDAPYFEAVFHSKFTRKLGELGLAVERNKTGWELAGIEKSTVSKFSRRTAQIEEEARRKGVLDPEAKSELGAKTRERKQKDLTLDDLRAIWTSRLTNDEHVALQRVAANVGGEAILENQDKATEAVRQSAEHCFERKSVVPERTLLADSLKRAVGVCSRETVETAFHKYDFVTAERDGRRMATTRAVLAEERQMIAFAREGRGTQAQFCNKKHEFQREWLNDGQRRAVEHILESRDRVILIRGAAGVGKTSMMQEAVEGFKATGKQVFTFAPSADASRGTLRDEGFENAETVARLLLDEKLQAGIRGQVIWIDEAGLLGTVTMSRVFDLAEKLDARVVLSGDRKQHGSVERGAALRLLEEEAGLVPAEIKDIQRQRGDYKHAIQALSDGRTQEGFRRLDRLGWVREVPSSERYKQLASDYVATVDEGRSALVVSPTHYEGEQITAEIRSELQRIGRIDRKERTFRTLESLDLTQAERGDAVNYIPGDVLEFHQNAKGYTKGQRVTVAESPLPTDQAGRFQAYRANELTLAPGDIVRLTKNGMTKDGKHRLNNGSIHCIQGFDTNGDLVLHNGWKVSRDFSHLTYGYVVTSHASQGKTVDRVFIGQSADSFGAASREQFYVSASRARQQVTVYTDDKESLLSAVQRSDDRLSATELVSSCHVRELSSVIARQQQLAQTNTAAKQPQQDQQKDLVYDR
jgi:conjugative relaxase-like TrwC/TraI family protein